MCLKKTDPLQFYRFAKEMKFLILIILFTATLKADLSADTQPWTKVYPNYEGDFFERNDDDGQG